MSNSRLCTCHSAWFLPALHYLTPFCSASQQTTVGRSVRRHMANYEHDSVHKSSMTIIEGFGKSSLINSYRFDSFSTAAINCPCRNGTVARLSNHVNNICTYTSSLELMYRDFVFEYLSMGIVLLILKLFPAVSEFIRWNLFLYTADDNTYIYDCTCMHDISTYTWSVDFKLSHLCILYRIMSALFSHK